MISEWMRQLGIDLTGLALLLEGAVQSGVDRLLLEGDMQSGADVLRLEGQG